MELNPEAGKNGVAHTSQMNSDTKKAGFASRLPQETEIL
jgi:hypothetical protein